MGNGVGAALMLAALKSSIWAEAVNQARTANAWNGSLSGKNCVDVAGGRYVFLRLNAASGWAIVASA